MEARTHRSRTRLESEMPPTADPETSTVLEGILGRDQALSLWNGSSDSKTLDYQRTYPREYQIAKLTQRKLEYKFP